MSRFRTKEGLSKSRVLYIKSRRHVCFRTIRRGSSWSNIDGVKRGMLRVVFLGIVELHTEGCGWSWLVYSKRVPGTAAATLTMYI